jgi:hypothetical protein
LRIFAGYKTPSAIQMQCIPLGLMNRDVVGIAQVSFYTIFRSILANIYVV